MNAGLADGTTTGNLVLQQAKIVPQTQHFFDFSHGQSLLGHSVSPLARGEIPIGCPAPLSAPTQKARSRNVNINSGSNRLFHRGSDYSHPRNLYSHARNPYSHPPVIFIHIAPESVFTCPGIRTLGKGARPDALPFRSPKAEKFDNAVRKMFSVSKEELLKREAK